jgi:hypothetical protein
MSDLIDALDSAPAEAGEDIILRRVVGTAPNQVSVDVTCRAPGRWGVCRADRSRDSGHGFQRHHFADADPGGVVEALLPFNVDQSIPRAGMMRGQAPKDVVFVDTKVIGGEVVRHNMRVRG